MSWTIVSPPSVKPIAATLSPGIYNITDSKNHALVSTPVGQTLVPTTHVVGTALSQQWLVTGDGVITPMDVSSGTKTCVTLAEPATPAANQPVILNSIAANSTKWIVCGVSYHRQAEFSSAYIMTHDLNNSMFYWGLDSNQNVVLQSELSAGTRWNFIPVFQRSALQSSRIVSGG